MAEPIRSRRAVERAILEHEMTLVDGAISLLATGGADRVTLTGLRFAERILPAAQRLARTQRVVVRPLWRPAGGGCDIALEPNV